MKNPRLKKKEHFCGGQPKRQKRTPLVVVVVDMKCIELSQTLEISFIF
jgi:hypothetical protein